MPAYCRPQKVFLRKLQREASVSAYNIGSVHFLSNVVFMQVIFCRSESTSHLQSGVDLWTQPFRWKNQTDCILHTDCISVLERVRGAYRLVGREMSVTK